MKILTRFFCALLLVSTATAQTATTPIKINLSVDGLKYVTVEFTDLGFFQPLGSADEAMKRYPALASAIKAALESSLDGLDEVAASKRVSEMDDKGIPLSKTAADKHAKRIKGFVADREPKLKNVALTDPVRAAKKMAEYIDAGIPISKATRDAVNKAQPKPPTLAPSPTPTPSDGLD